LRLLTYLAPGLPLGLFEQVGCHLERVLGVRTTLASDPTRSAPDPERIDPFTAGEADVGFLCAPGYVWLSDRTPPVVELVPAAFQFDDPRCRNRPVYFADLVVASGSSARSFDDLRGARWAFNDEGSLSGYFSVLDALRRRGTGPEFFSSAVPIGSHHAALAAIAAGTVDCAAIDSNTLLLERRRRADLGLRVLESFGPYPIQPVVVRAALAPDLKRGIAAALLAMYEDEHARAALARHAVRRFAPVAPADYEPERALLRNCGVKRALP